MTGIARATKLRAMRPVIFALLAIACSKSPHRAPDPAEWIEAPAAPVAAKPTEVVTLRGREPFPVPGDAIAGEPRGSLAMYTFARYPDAVIADLRATLRKRGWAIAKDEPGDTMVALEVHKHSVRYRARIWGSATGTTQMIVMELAETPPGQNRSTDSFW